MSWTVEDLAIAAPRREFVAGGSDLCCEGSEILPVEEACEVVDVGADLLRIVAGRPAGDGDSLEQDQASGGCDGDLRSSNRGGATDHDELGDSSCREDRPTCEGEDPLAGFCREWKTLGSAITSMSTAMLLR